MPRSNCCYSYSRNHCNHDRRRSSLHAPLTRRHLPQECVTPGIKQNAPPWQLECDMLHCRTTVMLASYLTHVYDAPLPPAQLQQVCITVDSYIASMAGFGPPCLQYGSNSKAMPAFCPWRLACCLFPVHQANLQPPYYFSYRLSVPLCYCATVQQHCKVRLDTAAAAWKLSVVIKQLTVLLANAWCGTHMASNTILLWHLTFFGHPKAL